ncbi:MAG: radical SAM protein [Gemmatimonadetes bacterium]|nr:radical SAM protein [Gemmatimonadota bacterium]
MGERETTSTPSGETAVRRAVTSHPRLFENNRYVYPVLSRRSGGISVGINLNPDKICNFDCIYCQVDRKFPPVLRDVDEDRIIRELTALLDDTLSGGLYQQPSFRDIPDHLQRINDIAFSGDGEPTTYPRFREIVEKTTDVKREFGLPEVKITAITNCTRFHVPAVLDAFEVMHRNNGEIWAKLEAGTAEYYHLVERTKISFQRIVDNLNLAARRWPLVIQSLFMRVHGQPPPDNEILAFCSLLSKLLQQGGQLKNIQIYTVARKPAESYVTALSDAEVDRIAQTTRENLPGISVESYYGA